MKGIHPLHSTDIPGIFATPSGDDSYLISLQDSDAEMKEPASAPAEGDALRLKAWLALALQSAEIGVWEWDIGTGLFHVSTQWTHALGFAGKNAAPRTLGGWLNLVHPEDRPACDCFVSALTDGGGVVRQVEMRLRRPDGSYGWQQCRGRSLAIADGTGLAAIGVLHDVTAKHETLARLLQVERLETIGQLTGGLAHDFNNLLTVIQGNVDLLNDTLGDDALHAPILEEIGTVVERGAALTRRLLSFARHDRQATAHADPDMLVAGLLPLLSHTLGGRVALCTDLAAKGWTVDVDARQFENAIINLAINARDAMPAGGTLTLTTCTATLTAADIHPERDEKPGAYVIVAVADTGQGMPPEVLARVFEPFFTTKADKGTGLGIPMVARFVHQAGGYIRIESVVGIGTTMRLYIPKSGAPI